MEHLYKIKAAVSITSFRVCSHVTERLLLLYGFWSEFVVNFPYGFSVGYIHFVDCGWIEAVMSVAAICRPKQSRPPACRVLRELQPAPAII